MMATDELIRVELICSSYSVESSFIDSLYDLGLIEITIVDENKFLEAQRINDLEKMIRMHYDLDINLEGIETISHLLNQINRLHEEMNMLKNRLRFFENA
ncbi:MAG TPA: chaperone modulator CbpM [Saprospiraceae bacterium]|nr:chaperone modulator CbpM [Saprospiraceae bacterium]